MSQQSACHLFSKIIMISNSKNKCDVCIIKACVGTIMSKAIKLVTSFPVARVLCLASERV